MHQEKDNFTSAHCILFHKNTLYTSEVIVLLLTSDIMKKLHTCRKHQNTTKNCNIKANLGKVIAQIILKVYINKILYLSAFICFLFHVNMFYAF